MARRGDDVPGESPGVGHHRSNDRNGRVFFTSVRDGEDDDRKRTSARSDKNPIDLWRKTLTEEDREMLKKMLPETTRNDENLVENVVKDLFTGKTFHFDNPAERVWNQIREGERHPHFARAKRIRKELQKRNSFLSLRKKHDEVVDNLDQMRKLWMRLGEEVGMKERRKLWEEHLEVKAQRRKNLENARKKNAILAKQMKQQKTQGGGGGGSEREGSVSAFGGADEQEAPPT